MSMTAETIYQTLFGIGAVGLLAQTVMGFAHVGGGHNHGHGADHGHADFNHGGASHAGHHLDHGAAHTATPAGHSGDTAAHGHGQHGHQTQHSHDHDGDNHGRSGGSSLGSAVMGLLSPLTLFSAALGTGATGLLLGAIVRSSVLLALAAVLGGIILYAAVVQPIYRVIFGFASRPAEALEGAVAKSAEAMTRFDARGQGIVKVNVDGQIVRLLAHLDPEDAKNGVAVSPGESLVVISVDSAKNVCQVTRL